MFKKKSLKEAIVVIASSLSFDSFSPSIGWTAPFFFFSPQSNTMHVFSSEWVTRGNNGGSFPEVLPRNRQLYISSRWAPNDSFIVSNTFVIHLYRYLYIYFFSFIVSFFFFLSKKILWFDSSFKLKLSVYGYQKIYLIITKAIL